MIKWHINLKERTGIMKKKKSGLLKSLLKNKGDMASKENRRKRSKNYAAIASVNRKYYKIVREHEMLISLLAVSHFLYTILMAGFYNINLFASLESGLLATVPSVIVGTFFIELIPNTVIVENVDKAKKFLLETGQKTTYENINVIVGGYEEGKTENGWKKIEDMLYEDRKVPAFENVKNILGSSATGKLNEAVPAK